VSEARYERVARDLRDKIRRGELGPGDQLPTEKALQEQYGVSVTVTRAALAQLRSEGLIISEQGRGSFVRQPREQIRMSAYRYRRNSPDAPHRREAQAGGWVDDFSATIGTSTATETIAGRLRIQPGDAVSEARYLRTVDGEPVQVSMQWEPLEITKGTRAERPGGGELGAPDVITRMGWIEYEVTEVTEVIRARMPNPEETRELDIPTGIPVFSIERTHWAGERPVETADIVIRADRLAINNTISVT
jgi:GntR family transcriptional regulator